MWFWFALIAILFWSGSDLFSKMGSVQDDKYSHWKIVIAVGGMMGLHALVMLGLAAAVQAHPALAETLGETLVAELPIGFSLDAIITYLPASVAYILSMILGYVGLRYVVLSVSTPICNSSGAVVAVLCFVFLKQSMTATQLIGVCCVCVGVFLLSLLEKRQEQTELKQENSHSVIAIAFPLLYCLIDALGTFVDGWLLEETDEAGNVVSGLLSESVANTAYELTFLLMAIVAFVYVFVIRRDRFRRGQGWPVALAGVCETAGQFAYIYALAGNTIVAAPMISSYCIFSLLWARLVLKEKLTAAQYGVIALAAVGIVLLGIE